MRGKRFSIGLRTLAIFAVTLLVTSTWAATNWNEKVLHSFCSQPNCTDGDLSLRRPDLRCRRQSLRHDRLGRHLRLRDGVRVDAQQRAGAGRRRCCIASTSAARTDACPSRPA